MTAKTNPKDRAQVNPSCRFYVESLGTAGLCYWIETGMCLNNVNNALQCPQARQTILVRKMRQRGFSLIELLISLAIMGILSGIIMPNMTTMLRSSYAAAANTEAALMANAQLVFYLDNHEWAATSDNLVGAGLVSGLPKARYSFSGANVTGAEPWDYGRGVWRLINWQSEIGRWY